MKNWFCLENGCCGSDEIIDDFVDKYYYDYEGIGVEIFGK